MKLTEAQRAAAIRLSLALTEASETGLFDEMGAEISRKVINQFCDDANYFIGRHTVQQWVLADYDNTGLMQIQRNGEGALKTDDEAILAAVRDAECGDESARAALQQHILDYEKIRARKIGFW